jgi:hypothetical protein
LFCALFSKSLADDCRLHLCFVLFSSSVIICDSVVR